MKKLTGGFLVVLAAGLAGAAPIVDVSGVGNKKFTASVNVSNAAFNRSLQKNLELSGLFTVIPNGSIKVTGAPGAVVAEGSGKRLNCPYPFADDKAARMVARQLSDAMVAAYSQGQQKGFACDPIAFVSRRGKDQTELCMCYPDGFDIRQLTSRGKQVVGPRWKDANTLFYTGILDVGPQIWEYDVATCQNKLRWSFRGLATGACVSPDGRKAAIVLSFQGNPELYVIDLASSNWTRLTNTPGASEGQPAWSPDGKKIVYVSDETRHPQLYVLDVATKAKRRLTSKGSQNVDPDWGKDGRITYITKRGGAQVAVMNPAEGEAGVTLVTEPGNWRHPSWSRDARHVVASRDRALFVVDTLEGGDKPRQVFFANGNWVDPTWSK